MGCGWEFAAGCNKVENGKDCEEEAVAEAATLQLIESGEARGPSARAVATMQTLWAAIAEDEHIAL